MMLPGLACVVGAFVLGVAGCAEAPVDPPPPKPPEPRFEPAPGGLTSELFQRLEFAVFDEEGAPLTASWTAAGAPQGQFSRFLYQPSSAGPQEIRASLSYAGQAYEAAWQLQVSDVNSSETPPVSILRMVPGDEPGSVVILWERPPGSLIEVPLKEFLIYWSDAPIDPGQLAGANEVVRSIDASRIEQRYAVHGLVETEPAYVRIVARDLLERISAPSAQASAPSTGHFEVIGSLTSIRVLEDVAPMVNGLIELDGRREVSAADGSFSFANLPAYPTYAGYTPPPGPILRATDSSGILYYSVVSQANLPMMDQRFDLLMLPREFVQIDPARLEDPSFISLLDFLILMTRNVRVAPVLEVPRWENYPVTVYAPELVLPGVNGTVDYRAAFAAAVDGWNGVAGEELLVLADASETAGIGVVYAVDLGPSGNLGETLVVAPVGGNLFRTIPEVILIRLRSFSSQSVANQIVTHEMGHALLLDHSPSLRHIMEASVPTETVNRDEAHLARIIRHLPQRMDLRWYEQPEKRELRFGIDLSARRCGTALNAWESLR